MKNQGWVKVHRKIRDKAFYRKPEYLAVWFHVLLNINHSKKEFMWNNKTMILNPGQGIFSQRKISALFNISLSKVNRILKHFKSEGQIETQGTNKYTIITVCKWHAYQANETPNETPVELNKNEKNEINIVFSFWNEQKIIQHRKITDAIITKIRVTLKDYSVDEIKETVSNYSKILHSDDYYYTHRWTLRDFLHRAFDKFTTQSCPFKGMKKNSKESDFNQKPPKSKPAH